MDSFLPRKKSVQGKNKPAECETHNLVVDPMFSSEVQCNASLARSDNLSTEYTYKE